MTYTNEKRARSDSSVIERMTYQTMALMDGGWEPVTKEALVYLPAGYSADDEAKRYDVLYLIHGRNQAADYLLTGEDVPLARTLDELIAREDLEPLIVVTPTYRSSTEELGYTEEASLLRPFGRELRESLMPAVAEQYRTFAVSGSLEDLQEARDHQALGGFFFGAVATWYGFMQELDVFSRFVPICGDCWVEGIYGGLMRAGQTALSLQKAVQRSGKSPNEFRIFLASGTLDPLHRSVDRMAHALRAKSDVFTTDNFSYQIKKGGTHSYKDAVGLLAQQLLVLFREDELA